MARNIRRYSRQISVDFIGEPGQNRLLFSTVAVVGCGALGSMVAMQLAAAGIGKIIIADFDTVDISNLQRQFFFKTEEAGKLKAELLAQRMKDINPECDVEVLVRMIDGKLAKDIFTRCEFIIDATDNPASKIMIETVCQEIGKVCCIGGVSEFHGQVMTIAPGHTTFGELFGQEEETDFLPCSAGGVLGPAAALCASIQASEAIKYLTGAGETLAGSILTFDLLNDSFQKIDI